MNIDSQILFFFSALGAFNSSLLAIYFFFFAKPKHISNIFLGGLLAVMSIRIWKSLFYYFNPDLSRIFLQIGLSACFLIGPFLYLYISSKVKPVDENKTKWLIHIALISALVLVVGVLYPYQTEPEIWWKYIIKNIYWQWLAYILLSGFLLKELIGKAVRKKAKLDYDEFWVLRVLVSVCIVWLAYYTTKYTSYIVGALSFSVVLYLSVILIYFQRKNKQIAPKKKYVNNKISEREAAELFAKINHTISEEKLFTNPNLTLPLLAKILAIRPHLLSQFLNDNLDKNFSNFINEYRISEAKKLLISDKNLKIEVIAEDCGFNSNSTFYSAFKKVTGTTPAKYAEAENAS